MSRFFTTGQVARLCGISPRTVANYCDEGKIESLQSPATGYRRIPMASLERFLSEHGYPRSLLFLQDAPKILVVEDNRADRILMLSVLAQAFPRAAKDAVEDGYEALIRIGENPPDLLILDLNLPGMDGIEVCRRLRGSPRTRGMSILPVSGFDDEDRRLRLAELGVAEVLHKTADIPVLRAAVVAAVTRLLGLDPSPAGTR